MLEQACRREEGEGGARQDGDLNKVSADPTGAPTAPAVAAVNRHGI